MWWIERTASLYIRGLGWVKKLIPIWLNGWPKADGSVRLLFGDVMLFCASINLSNFGCLSTVESRAPKKLQFHFDSNLAKLPFTRGILVGPSLYNFTTIVQMNDVSLMSLSWWYEQSRHTLMLSAWEWKRRKNGGIENLSNKFITFEISVRGEGRIISKFVVISLKNFFSLVSQT